MQNVCKESLKSDGQPFHQYQHNEQSSFTSNHKSDHEYDVWNSVCGL